jgi:hypothetical protein
MRSFSKRSEAEAPETKAADRSRLEGSAIGSSEILLGVNVAMDDQDVKALEASMAHVAQKIKLWRAASMQLDDAEKSLAFAERVLCGVTDSLVDEAMKITNAIKSKEPRSMARFASGRAD